MSANFSISVDAERCLVRIVLDGFFSPVEVERATGERNAVFADLPGGPGRYASLCDVTGCKIQHQDVIAAFQAMMADSRFQSRRLAIVTGSSLARMQVRRLLSAREHVQLFPDEDAAMAWLFDLPIRRAATAAG